jgi:hypothetical protein
MPTTSFKYKPLQCSIAPSLLIITKPQNPKTPKPRLNEIIL